MTRACVTAWAVVALLPGCGRAPLPKNPSPPKDRAELEARYDLLQPGVGGPEVEAFMGKRGAALAGYASAAVRRRPDGAAGAVEAAAGELDRYWASDDGTAAVRVVFAANGRARLVELLTITPMGPPPPPPPPERTEAPAP